jgi:hypothetical protein
MTTRREFVKTISIASVYTAFFEPKSHNAYSHVHVKESNFTLSAVSPSILGFLYTDSPARVEKDINRLRAIHHYRTRLTFRSTDKFKFDFAKDLIDYFFKEQSIVFYSRVITDQVEHNNSIHDLIYRLNYKKSILDLQQLNKTSEYLLDFITYLPGRHHIDISQKVPYKNFKTTKKELVSYLNKSLQTVHLKMEAHNYNNLSQLCDFLTGNIFGDQRGIENKMKRELLKYLKTKLGVKHLKELYNVGHHRRFIIMSS